MYVTITDLREAKRRTENGFLLSTIIKCVEFGDRELSGWKGKLNYKWQVGDRVDIAVSKKRGKDKKTVFYNYKAVESIGPEVEFRNAECGLRIDEKIKEYLKVLGMSVEDAIRLGILVARILTLPDKQRMYTGMGWLTKKPIQELISYS